MAQYVIGDIHGCHRTLLTLLARIDFDPEHDRLWLVGDLVNRGPASLEVLRWAREQGTSVLAVLGNHDVHLLACDLDVRAVKPRDTLTPVLDAEDRQLLVAWLRERPLLHREHGQTLVHAGLHPSWTVERAGEIAAEVERLLRGPRARELLRALYEDTSLDWQRARGTVQKAAAALRVFVSIRACNADGRLCAGFTGPPDEVPAGYQPWYTVPGRNSAGHDVVFGHWATLGLHQQDGITALDTGCAWGAQLTAIRLDDGRVFQQSGME